MLAQPTPTPDSPMTDRIAHEAHPYAPPESAVTGVAAEADATQFYLWALVGVGLLSMIPGVMQ